MKSKKKALTPGEKLAQALVPREEWPYELPKGWVWTYMGNIAEWGSGGTPSRKHPEYYGGEIPWIKTGELNDSYIYDTSEKITEEAVNQSSAKIYPKDTVMIAMYGATIGKTGILGVEAATNQACACAKVFPFACFKYLFYYLISKKSYFINSGKGGAQPNISQYFLKRFYFPLPSLSEQQRIVNKIESLFAKLDEAGDRLQKVLDGYEARRAAILHEAFSGKWTGDHGAGNMSVPKGWRKAAIKDIYHRLSYGTSKKSLAEGKYIVIRMGNLQNGTIDWSNLAYSNDEAEYAKYKLNPGDVLFNRTNSSELVGKTSIYKGEYPAIYAGYLIKLDYDRALINGEYLNYYLNSPRAKLYYNQVKTDGVNQSNINSKKIGNFEIAFPSMEEQNNIVSKLNHIFENDKKSLFLAKKSLSKIDLLKKSILTRAFRGELGTQDPSDPSVLELLKECVMAGKEDSQS